MISRISARTRIAFAIVPAVVGVIAVGIFGFTLMGQDLDDLRHDVERSTATRDGFRLVEAMSSERVLGLNAVAVADEQSTLLFENAVEETDEAASALMGSLSSIDQVYPLEQTTRRRTLESQLRAIREAREVVAADESVRSVYDAYQALPADAGALASGILNVGNQDPNQRGVGVLSRVVASDADVSSAVLVYLADPEAAEESGFDQEISQLVQNNGVWLDLFASQSSARIVDLFRDAGKERAVRESDESLQFASDPDTLSEIEFGPQKWSEQAVARSRVLGAIQDDLLESSVTASEGSLDDAEAARNQYLQIAALVASIAVLAAGFFGRSVISPLVKLRRSAEEITEKELPAMMLALEDAQSIETGMHFSKVDVRGHDEFAAAAHAINAMGTLTTSMTRKQAELMRKGIGDVFVSLAKRNQPLLDRQIECIDALEANEENPDQLEGLYRLDHLASRMRRNAESMLVLAGEEPQRRRRRNISMADVIRVAVGEVEDFGRMNLRATDESELVGDVAVDLAHLLAELMENAAQASPGDEQVDIIGHARVTGGYTISIRDRGDGVHPSRLRELNQVLATPPPPGAAFSGTLGFVVVGTLAARHGIEVRLAEADLGGIVATVVVPASVVTNLAEDANRPSLLDVVASVKAGQAEVRENMSREANQQVPAEVVEVVDVVESTQPAQPTQSIQPTGPLAPDHIEHIGQPDSLLGALPEGGDFDAGLTSLLGPEDVDSSDTEHMDAPTPQSTETFDALDPLPQRPRDHAPTELPQRGDAPSITASPRSPADVHDVLSRYRQGLQQGRNQSNTESAGDGPAEFSPNGTEGTDR